MTGMPKTKAKNQHLKNMKLQVSYMSPARSIRLGLSVAALFVLVGCATQQPLGVVRSTAPQSANVTLPGPGPIAVRPVGLPAKYSFDKADGQIDYPGDGARNAAADVFEWPSEDLKQLSPAARAGVGVGVALLTLTAPAWPLAWCAGKAVATPLAAGAGALGANHNMLSAEQLAEAEARLTQVMARMADQRRFRDLLLEVGNEGMQGSLVPAEGLAAPAPAVGSASAVLETRIEELHLVRTGKRDTSFALLVKARVRLLRADDNTVLYDYPFEYQSGTALFLDWTCQDAFRASVETAYRVLAAHAANRFLPTHPEAPVLARVAYKNNPIPEPRHASVVAAR